MSSQEGIKNLIGTKRKGLQLAMIGKIFITWSFGPRQSLKIVQGSSKYKCDFDEFMITPVNSSIQTVDNYQY